MKGLGLQEGGLMVLQLGLLNMFLLNLLLDLLLLILPFNIACFMLCASFPTTVFFGSQ